MPRLRPHDRHRLPARDSRRGEDARGRRDQAVADEEQQGVPGRSAPLREAARHPRRRAVARAHAARSAPGSSTAKARGGSASGTASRGSSRGSSRKPTRCTCACCCRNTAATTRARPASGARLKPASLDWRLGSLADAAAVVEPSRRFRAHLPALGDAAFAALPGLSIHDLMMLPVERTLEFFERVDAAAAARRRGRARARRDPDAPALSLRRRAALPHARSAVAHAVGRRGAAHQSDDGARHVARQHAVRARRAERRPAPARSWGASSTCSRSCATPATRCSSSSTTRRSCSRPTASSTWVPGPGRAGGQVVFNGSPAELVGARRLADGEVSARRARRSRAAARRAPSSDADPRLVIRGAREHNLQRRRRRDSAEPLRLRHGRQRLRQVDARRGRALQRPARAARQAEGRARRARRDRRASRRSPTSCSSTKRRSAARRARIPRASSACSSRSGSCSPPSRSRASAATRPARSASTPATAAAPRARATASSTSRCSS